MDAKKRKDAGVSLQLEYELVTGAISCIQACQASTEIIWPRP